MCQRVTCRTCKKATWSGCGQHKEMVLAGVPKSQRCQCGKTGAKRPVAAAAPEPKSGFFSRLFGK